MDKWYIIFGIGGWVCFIASVVLALLKFRIMTESWNADYQDARQELMKAEHDVHQWKGEYEELMRQVKREKMAEKAAKKIVEGKSDAG